jgi:hypothetical protein
MPHRIRRLAIATVVTALAGAAQADSIKIGVAATLIFTVRFARRWRRIVSWSNLPLTV